MKCNLKHILLVDIKLNRWDEAVADCNAVLKAEPQNMKGKKKIQAGVFMSW